MANREKVLNALENCTAKPKCRDCWWKECEHEHETVEIPLTLAKDALSLLKAQEPIKPKVDIDTWVCGNCGTRVEHQSMIGTNAVLAETFKFCPECGQAVKWDE